MLQLAIIADDLTGALDSSAPFAARGLSTVVLTDIDAVDAEAVRAADIICVCTSSRELSEAQARDRAMDAAQRLVPLSPRLIFKKVDSRLKGHVATETLAVASAFGRGEIVVAPAVPAQGRIVTRGALHGRGVAAPIPVAERFDGVSIVVPDTPDQAAFDRLVSSDARWPARLFVGASGLATALAMRLSSAAPRAPAIPTGKLLIAIGSRDPVSLNQIAQARALPRSDFIATVDGHLPPTGGADVMMCQAVPPHDADLPGVMATFGHAIAERTRRTSPDCLLISGGETAQTVLAALGVTSLQVAGEVLPGLALSWLNVDDRRIALITKSGGFGQPDDLVQIARRFLGGAERERRLFVGDAP